MPGPGVADFFGALDKQNISTVRSIGLLPQDNRNRRLTSIGIGYAKLRVVAGKAFSNFV